MEWRASGAVAWSSRQFATAAQLPPKSLEPPRLVGFQVWGLRFGLIFCGDGTRAERGGAGANSKKRCTSTFQVKDSHNP